jgi:hypothetical protein
MRILAIYTGDYGLRHIQNIKAHAPSDWIVSVWHAPSIFPLVIDDPADFLPEQLPQAELLLSFAEHKGVAELLPDLARLTGAQAVLAPVDNEAWLPRGLARQLHVWLEHIGVACATPKPLCSLTETDYLANRRQRKPYLSEFISEFARYFGQPKLSLTIDPDTRVIVAAKVHRDAVCGCARHVAESLVGVSVDDAEFTAGMSHHHFPCLASMGIDTDFGDTLMHVSGNLLVEHIKNQVKPYLRNHIITPSTRSVN